MPKLITAEDLSFILDEQISEDRFLALYKTGLRVVRSGYRGDPEAADPDAAEVIAGVLTGVLVRIASNPKGARQLNAGGAGLTFGGADDTISTVFSLTDDERADLAAVSPVKLPGRSGGAFTIRPRYGG